MFKIHSEGGEGMKWTVVKITTDGGQQAIPQHHILAARWGTPEEALSSMRYAKELTPGEYYVRSIEETPQKACIHECVCFRRVHFGKCPDGTVIHCSEREER
jgi:hypothetical protein